MTSASPTLTKAQMWLIEIALAVGGFGIGTGEFATMGLMPGIAEGLAKAGRARSRHGERLTGAAAAADPRPALSPRARGPTA